MLEFAGRAGDLGADLVMFPELAVCGYPPADLLEKPSFVARAEESVCELARWTAAEGRPAILCGSVAPAVEPEGKHVRNVAVLLDRGQVAFVQAKRLLPFYDVFDEQRYFEPAQSQALCSLRGQTLAITICEDAWNDKGFWPRRLYPVDPVEDLMRQWAEQNAPGAVRLILNISASPFWAGKRELRRRMLSALARAHGAVVAMVNQVGGNDSLIFDGASQVLGPDGETVVEAASFGEDMVLFDTGDLAEADAPARAPASGASPDSRDAAMDADPAARGFSAEADIPATWDALVLGTRDYLRKCGFKKALVGLSGGIDSALVAAIAVDALGPENVMGVGMPSEYSSGGSVDDARQLAANLQIRFETVPIHDIFSGFMEALDPLFAGTEFGLAEENLQARIRGTLLMAVSNKFGPLVLTTGNKSEMATGYSTLYGDMVGGLAVIGDVWKTRVYALSRYANREREIIPVATLTKPPSAELRPGQMDTDSLPPYEVLDPMLAAYVERYCPAEQIAREQGQELAYVQQVLRLVERNEYKRKQAAPVLKVTPKSFGPGRRFPIAVRVEV